MAQLNLYYRTQLESKVTLLPEQLDGNFDTHIINNLKEKIEGKTTTNGIVIRILKLVDYPFGIIDGCNFMGSTVLPVKYECFFCSPVKGLEIICLLENIVKGYLFSSNGPIIIAIDYNNIDLNKFEKKDNSIIRKKNNKEIKKGDFLKVLIINVNNNLGEQKIVVMCKLLDIASSSEIESFHEDQMLVTNGSLNDNKEFI